MSTDANTYPVAGLYTEQIQSMHDVFKPQNIRKMFSKHGFQYMPMFQIFRSLSKEEPIANDNWSGWEENWYHETVVNKTETTAGAAGAAVTLTLTAASHDAKGNSYPRIGQIITLPGTYMQVHITAKNVDAPAAHTITIKPSKSTDSIPVITANAQLAITSNAHGAGTGQPQGTVLGSTKRTFYAQIFKETIGAEGTQLVNEKWYNTIDNGKSVKGWYSPGYMRGEYYMALAMDGAFTWGDVTDNVRVANDAPKGAGNLNKTTKGIMRHASELGHDVTYTENAFTPVKFDQFGLYYKSQAVTSGYSFGWMGALAQNDVENGMTSWLGTNSDVNYTTAVKNVFNNNDKLAVGIGFDVIKKGGITHMLHSMDGWSNPKTFGAAGYDLAKYGLFTPLSKFKDPKTGAVMDNIGTKYRAMDGYSRRFEIWSVAGAGNKMKVTDIDEENTYFRSHVGLQAFKVNQFITLKPTV